MRPFAYARPDDPAGAVAALSEGREGSARFLGGGTNLVDLMKLLEASVRAATDQRAKDHPAPVSVAEAKQERASRPARVKAPAAVEAGEPDARPARRRKSA